MNTKYPKTLQRVEKITGYPLGVYPVGFYFMVLDNWLDSIIEENKELKTELLFKDFKKIEPITRGLKVNEYGRTYYL